MRRVGLLMLFSGLGLWLAAESMEGHGPLATTETRHLRAMKDRAQAPAGCMDMALADFPALPARLPLAEFERIERRGIRVEGYVQRIESAFDGDLHLTVVAAPSAAPGRGERYVSAEITPRWREGSRYWTLEGLAEALGSHHSGAASGARHPRRARLSGWFTYDFWFDALPAWAFDRERRVTGWEIHPVTRIEVWDDAEAKFVELPR